MRTVFLYLSVTLMLTILATPAFAQDKALERAQFMLRQMNSQKVALEQKNAELLAQIELLKKESAKALKEEKAGTQRLDTASKKKDESILLLREKLRETVLALRNSEAERLQANNNNQALDTELKRCVDNNQQLVQMNDRLIDNYNKKSCWDALAHAEPFTAIKQVEVENILQEYRFSNEDLLLRPAAGYEQAGELESRSPPEDI